jgi:hypothetical protein
MRIIAAGLILLVGSVVSASAQVLLQENFDSTSTLPPGWSVWNRQPFPISPQTNWTVRDTGVVPPGIGNNRTHAYTPPRAVGVSWWSSIDTTGAPSAVADAWLVTKRVSGVGVNDGVKFWASGGSTSFLDSLQVWASPYDSTTTGMISGIYLGSIIWPVGSIFGNFTEHVFSLSGVAGQPVCWIGFRYFMNCSVNGFYVHVDDVSVEQTSSVALTGDDIPSDFGLDQNYPNPFNGWTRIGFRIGGGVQTERVRLGVFDLLGREVATVVDEDLAPGSYSVPFNAPQLASGVYLCRLVAGGNVQTRRMILMK